MKFSFTGWIAIALGSSMLFLQADDAEDKATEERQKFYLYMQGRDIYQNQCQQCHGRNGRGDGDWAADWTQNRPRNFREGIFKFRSTPMGKLPTEDDLRRTIEGGISGTAMPAFGNHLEEYEYDAIIEYLKRFSKVWRDPENHGESIALEDPPAWWAKPESSEHEVAGKALFDLHCVTCHGPEGKGDGPGSKGLMDAWGFEITPADLTSATYKSGPKETDTYRTIATGLNGTPMVGFLGVMNAEQLWEIVAYVESLKEK